LCLLLWKGQKDLSKLDKAIKLCTEGNNLIGEGNKLCDEGDEPLTEGRKLIDEGEKLWAKGEKLWSDELIRLFGFIPDFMKSVEKFIYN